MTFVRKEAKELSPSSDIGLVNSLLNIYDSLLDDVRPTSRKQVQYTDLQIRQRLECRFLFALTWSIGGCLDTKSQENFDVFLKLLIEKSSLSLLLPLPNVSIYDIFYDGQEAGQWIQWSDIIPLVPNIPDNALFHQITIPTKDTARYSYLLDLLIQHQKPVLVVGPTGTGKSKYINEKLLHNLPKDNEYIPIFINFSARTSSNQTQDIIMSKLDKRRKGVFGPAVGKRCIIFIDDLNMPAKETYGAQPPIELLRQWFDHGNWYDRKDTSELRLVDTQCLAAMGPPGGGRTQITPRFARHFNSIAINSFDDSVMERIFFSIINWHFETHGFERSIVELGQRVLAGTMKVYKNALANLLPTPAKTHYTFNLRDFARVIQGIVMSSPDAYKDDSSIIRLWTHEIYRVYYDRLVSDDDRKWLFDCVKETINTSFQVDLDQLFNHVASGPGNCVQEEDMRAVIFGDFVPNRPANVDKLLYTSSAQDFY